MKARRVMTNPEQNFYKRMTKMTEVAIGSWGETKKLER